MPEISSLEVGGTVLPGVSITSLTIREALNVPYEITLVLLAEAGFDPAAQMQKTCAATLRHLGRSRRLAGTIVGLRLVENTKSGGAVQVPGGLLRYSWAMTVVPALALLGFDRRSQVFATDTNRTVVQLVTDMLDGSKPAVAYKTTEIDAKIPYPSLAMSIQWQESDLDYVMRMAEGAGIGFYFDVGDAGEVVCFFDQDGNLPELDPNGNSTLVFLPEIGGASSPALRSVGLRVTLAPSSATVTSYDYRDGQLPGNSAHYPSSSSQQAAQDNSDPVASLATIPSAASRGTTRYFDRDPVELYSDDPSRTQGWIDAITQRRAELGAAGQVVLEGSSDHVGLAPGRVFTLGFHRGTADTNPPELLKNQEFLVVSVEHRASFSQIGGSGPSTDYRNTFTAIPKATSYRPVHRTPVPVIAGIVLAEIDPTSNEASSSEPPARAQLDTIGCYRVKFGFDQRWNLPKAQQPAQGKWSAPIRQLTAHGGPADENKASTGLFFPLLPGTRVMVAFVGGDPDRPVIVGPAYDGADKSVVTQANATDNVLRTASGIVMKFGDGAAKPSS